MVVSVNTTEFEFSHGYKPRGYGLWWFEIGTEQECFSGLYHGARFKAIKKARASGVFRVKVLS